MRFHPALTLRRILTALMAVGLSYGASVAAGVVNPPPPVASVASCAAPAKTFKVAIDVGHSRQRPGATSAYGVGEFQFNRRLARVIRARLITAGFPATLLENASGREQALADRTARAARAHANLFLSVHHDSVQPRYLSTWRVRGRTQLYSDRYRGFSIFVSGANAQAARSRQFAHLLGDALLAVPHQPSLHHAQAIPGEGRRLLDAQRGIYRFDELAVLRTATMPAVLVEFGVIVHREEARWLSDSANRRRLADAVVQAVAAFAASQCAEK